MPSLELNPDSITVWYKKLLSSKTITADKRQEEAVSILHSFAEHLISSNIDTEPLSFFSGLTRGKKNINNKRGVYLHGNVGRGKTLLMDGFFLSLPVPKKKRVHFHSFMRHFHEDMQTYSKRVTDTERGTKQKKSGRFIGKYKTSSTNNDTLVNLANNLAKDCKVLCFDEFHISDIADAMIMSRLLKQLLDLGVNFVMTSNYLPQELYPNGLARHLFLPAIELIENNFTVFALDGDEDYRHLSLCDGGVYFYPMDSATKENMDLLFDKLSCGINLSAEITLQGRKINALRRSSDAIWFDFATLCQGERSQVDYLRLAERFGAIFLSAVPQLNKPQLAAAARRFTWLVDILYDRKISLVISSTMPTLQIYGKNNKDMDENGRTLSRLIEMQSAAYLKNTSH